MPLTIGTSITANARGKSLVGKVKKLNRTTCILNVIGGNTKFAIGTEIKCPYTLIISPGKYGEYGVDYDPEAKTAVTPIPDIKYEVDDFVPTDFWVRQYVYELIILGHIYNRLSPENLTCDGECSKADVARRFKELQQEKQAVFTLMKRQITEEQYYNIMKQFNDTIKNYIIADAERMKVYSY